MAVSTLESNPRQYVSGLAGLLPYLLVLLITVLEVVALRLIHARYAQQILQASYNVAIGHAEWRVYQSRILGPYLILAISKTLHMTYGVAREIFVPSFLLASNLMIFRLLASWFRDRWFALQLCFWHVALFLALQSSHFLYDWDVFDQLFFFLFAFGILTRRRTGWFVALFALELLNREAADLFALYICLRAFTDFWVERKEVGKLIAKVALGVALLSMSGAVTHWLRETLHKQPAAEIGRRQIVLGEHWQLTLNIHEMLPPYSRHTTVFATLAPQILIVAIFVLLYRARKVLWLPTIESALMVFLIFLSLCLFAVLTETRVLASLSPFLMLFAVPPARWVAARASVLSKPCSPHVD
jgi:hypothetical protein